MEMRVTIFFIITIAFIACQESAPPPEEDSGPKINYYEEGQKITAIAQAELLKNVKSAMKEGGPVNAIKYCNIHAMPLTDSLSNNFNCVISRVAIKNRSAQNEPADAAENILLNNYLEASLDGSILNDTLIAKDGKLLYYRPIMLGMEACLSCHGQVGTDINIETMSVLNELYPNDKATNYRMGEFRGAWRITFSL